MLNNSTFLEYVLKKAEQRRKSDKRDAVSGNYFFIALLETIMDYDNKSIAKELLTYNVIMEIAILKSLLKQYTFDRDDVIIKLVSIMKNPEYNSKDDEKAFAIIIDKAKLKAEKSSRKNIDASLLLELIIEIPTDGVRKLILNNKIFGDSDVETKDYSHIFSPKTSEGDTTTSKIKKTTHKPDTKKGAESVGSSILTSAIEKSRKLQDELLGTIFGQDHAVNAVVSGYFQSEVMAFSRAVKNKPRATYLFAGPPGVGKTFLAERTAEVLGLPFLRVDMSEYNDKNASGTFAGFDDTYKDSHEGVVTGFVDKNPKCIILFDEVEKADISIIHLFLQILDAGRLNDPKLKREVSFSDAILIFTTNAGRNLYEDISIPVLGAVPRKKILKALSSDIDPTTGNPLFPGAICSRFASGNVVMFNRLEANHLFTIVQTELSNNVKAFSSSINIDVEMDDRIATAIMLSEGAKADARTVKGRANSFFYAELFELFRLLSSGTNIEILSKLQKIRVSISIDDDDKETASLFANTENPEILIFADKKVARKLTLGLSGVTCHVAESIEQAKEILFNHDISIIICDVNYNIRNPYVKLMNIEDIASEGRDFIDYAKTRYTIPMYILQEKEGDISDAEFVSFAAEGIRDIITIKSNKKELNERILGFCKMAYQQNSLMKLTRANRVVSYKSSQTISDDDKIATINLFDLQLTVAVDTEDSASVLDNVSKPDVRFDQVIGAEDAKEELKYFVEYLKNPTRFMRQGVKAPKGVLLYGPPGTGKTLLAKAMAGESDVTFLMAEGNQFLKKWVGEGSDSVHALFAAARKYAPSIIFIDEIDSIGKNRDSSDGHTSANTLTALLTEMDGFKTDTSKPVFVLAATNYNIDPRAGNSIDPALLRRFDRRIYVDLPNKEERKKFLLLKLEGNKNVKLSADQIDNIALRSTGMSLAELDSVIELALRSAIRSKSGIVSDEAFDKAFETFTGGEERHWDPSELMRTARHEAGHALISWLTGDKPTYVTIVARGDHGGYMLHADRETKGSYTKSELLSLMRTSLAGRAAEMEYYGEEEGLSTGISSDIRKATYYAERIICEFAMDSEIGISYIDPDKIGETGKIRDRVNVILEQELKNARELIAKNKKAIDAMVEELLVKNHLKESEIDSIFTKYVNKK